MTFRKDAPQPDRQPGQPWSLDAAAAFLGISRRHLERLVAADRVKLIPLGHRKFVADAELKRLASEGC